MAVLNALSVALEVPDIEGDVAFRYASTTSTASRLHPPCRRKAAASRSRRLGATPPDAPNTSTTNTETFQTRHDSNCKDRTRGTTMITEVAMAAETAVTLILPFLTEAGKSAAKKIGEESASAGLGVLGWMREKLAGRAKEALADLETKPESTDNQADLRKQLTSLLEREPALLAELRALLPAAATNSESLSQNVGSGGKGALNKGDNNIIIIS
jgi:hypothetical protein